jgi:hypothetical protein
MEDEKIESRYIPPKLPAFGRRKKTIRLPGKERYQGKEIQVTLQAPSREDMDDMLTDLQRYASEHGMEAS